MKLPSEQDEGKPSFLSDAWEWSDTSGAWEQMIGDARLVYLLGYVCVFDVLEKEYVFELHSFIYDTVIDEEDYNQSEIDKFFGLDTMGQLESGPDYDLDDDISGIREDILGPFKCECGNDEFYVIMTDNSSGYTSEYNKMYGCTAPKCPYRYFEVDIPSGVPVNVTNIHYA